MSWGDEFGGSRPDMKWGVIAAKFAAAAAGGLVLALLPFG